MIHILMFQAEEYECFHVAGVYEVPEGVDLGRRLFDESLGIAPFPRNENGERARDHAVREWYRTRREVIQQQCENGEDAAYQRWIEGHEGVVKVDFELL